MMTLYTAIILILMSGAWIRFLGMLAAGAPGFPPPPLLTRVERGPWVLGWLVIVYLTMAVLAGLLYGRFFPLPRDPKELTASQQLILMAMTNVLVIAFGPWMLGWSFADLGGTPKRMIRGVAVGAEAFFLTTPVILLVSVASTRIWTVEEHPLEQMLRKEMTWDTALLAVISAVILAPLAEELLFRGLFLRILASWFQKLEWIWGQRTLALLDRPPDVEPVTIWEDALVRGPGESSRLSRPLGESSENAAGSPSARVEADAAELMEPPDPALGGVPDGCANAGDEPLTSPGRVLMGYSFWIANIVTSGLFAIMHAPQWPAPIPLFILSLVLGGIYQRTGSLLAPIVLHLVFNGNSTAILLLSLKGAG